MTERTRSPEKVRSLEIFSNDVNQKNLFATWKSMEPWPGKIESDAPFLRGF